jgi:leader peptidase (prepilin peptidase)/N-methyltransferase
MNAIWATAGALGALPAGTVLSGQVARLSVPHDEPEEGCCRLCAAPLPAGPAVRCGHCGRQFAAFPATELGAAAVTALLLARFGPEPAVAAFAYLGVLGVALAQIDIAVQRLPDRLTGPAYPALALLLGMAAAVGHDWGAFARALLGGLVLAACYLVLGLISGGRLGGGDVKLSGLIGMVLGWIGWDTLLRGATVGWVLAGLAGMAMLLAGRARWRSDISFGPYMLWGALIALVASGA